MFLSRMFGKKSGPIVVSNSDLAKEAVRADFAEFSVLGSKRIMNRSTKVERSEIWLALDATDEEIEQARAELNLHRKFYEYKEEETPILVEFSKKLNKNIMYYEDTHLSISGTDYNESVYTNVVWVEDLIKEELLKDSENADSGEDDTDATNNDVTDNVVDKGTLLE